MTTYEYATLRTRGLLASFALYLAPRRRKLAYTLGRGWAKVRPVAMTVAGLACITTGLFTISTLAGLIGAGLSFFVVDWVGRSDERRR